MNATCSCGNPLVSQEAVCEVCDAQSAGRRSRSFENPAEHIAACRSLLSVPDGKSLYSAINERVGSLVTERGILLGAVKAAYRKHHLDDPNIGYEELNERLNDALSECLAGEEYDAWCEEIKHLVSED